MNRRLLLKMLAAAPLSHGSISDAARADDHILELDCAELVARIRDGSLRAENVCAKFLQQYERQRSLNVFTWIDPERALSRARDVDIARDKGMRLPALAGLPILIKDNIDTIGFPTSAGTASLRGYFPSRNASVVERLLGHGAIIMGKGNMHELAFGVTSSNPTFGFVHNPYDPDLIPGGSSGGSAAAIAARIVPAALGTDTAGSVRIPSAFCGTVGLRPSIYPRKLYSQRGVVPVTLDLDTIGPMGRSVSDVAMLHAMIVGQGPMRARSVEGVRIGVPRIAYWDDVDPEVLRVAEGALLRLRDHGAVLVEIDVREVTRAALKVSSTLASVGIRDLENFLRDQVPSVSLRDLTSQIASRDVRARIEEGLGKCPYPDLLNARRVGRDATCAAYRAVFRQFGIQAVVFPTEVLSAPRIRTAGDDQYDTIELNGRAVSQFGTLLRNTLLAPALGTPAVSLPAGLTNNGLPVALEFDGLPGEDNALLSLAAAAEGAIGRLPTPSVVRQSARGS